MRELRRLGARAFENERVLVSVREMVLAADDVADTEIDVVGTGGEVVGWHAVGTEEREVFDVVGGFDLLTCAPGNTEAKGEGLSRRGSAVALRAGKLAHTGVEEPGLIGTGFFAVVDLDSSGVGGGKVAVSQSLLKDGVGDLAMQGQAFGLLIFLVPAEVEP